MDINNEDIELIESFVNESYDLIDDVEPIFIQLQQQANENDGYVDKESINMIFRLFHSMKGAAGFLKMNNIAEITHHAETLLDAFRKNDIQMKPEYIDVQLKTIDALREILENVHQNLTDDGFDELKVAMVARLEEAINSVESSGKSGDEVKTEATTNNDSPPATIDLESSDEESATTTEESESTQEEELPEIEISPEMAAGFAQEAQESLDNAEQALLDMEKSCEDGSDAESFVSEAFRNIHSFKGNCGFMQQKELEKISHIMENILDAIRQGESKIEPQVINVLLETLDSLRSGLTALAETGEGKIANCDVMADFLAEFIPQSKDKKEETSQTKEKKKEEAPTSVDDTPPSPPVTPPAEEQKSEDTPDKAKNTTTTKPPAKAPLRMPQQRSNIRVDIEKLDALINLVGELVIAESMVLKNKAILKLEDEVLAKSIHHLQRISSDLQDVAMSVRMIPLAATFKKMVRLVHDLSRKAGKKANIELVGEDTEVDKNVIEQISDPLVHIIRNSLDHGVEPPDERIEAGKIETGTVVLESKHEGGEVVIIIKDDGRGLDRQKLLAKGIKNGIVDGDGSDMSNDEVYSLIFEPGFSTAEKITDISGRGVGMDVVRKNIEKLNGRVTVKSKLGQGTEVFLHIPLTLAIIDGMNVKVGETQYTIPLLSIRESIRADEERTITVTPDGQESILLRNQMIPIVRLHVLFDKSTEVTDLHKGIMVIVECDSQAYALFVDTIVGQQEIVIKGLTSYFGQPKGISGCTVLGDGEVSLIIDIASLIQGNEKMNNNGMDSDS